jgi:hypothetical protein
MQDNLTILKQKRRDTSPGPDGLNVAFYREAWERIGLDIMHHISHSHDTQETTLFYSWRL